MSIHSSIVTALKNRFQVHDEAAKKLYAHVLRYSKPVGICATLRWIMARIADIARRIFCQKTEWQKGVDLLILHCKNSKEKREWAEVALRLLVQMQENMNLPTFEIAQLHADLCALEKRV